LKAFKVALEEGATDVRLHSSEDYDTKKLEYFNLIFDADHSSSAISHFDDGLFSKGTRDLK
jgi:hypothetical protein